MTPMGDPGQPSYAEWIVKILACGKFVTQSFLVILLMATVAMFAWLGCWFVYRAGLLVFHRYLETPWR